jgi:N-acetyl-beta-hexosaminidase
MELKSFPNITYNGAYSADQVYTREMMNGIVSHTLKLGIRIIIEFDNPGHTRALGFDPDLRDLMRCFNYDHTRVVKNVYKIRGFRSGVLDPSYPKTFEVIKAIL